MYTVFKKLICKKYSLSQSLNGITALTLIRSTILFQDENLGLIDNS